MSNNLGRIQAFSLITKAVTTALGIVQSFIVIKLLTRGEYGLVGLVMSIGGLIGVSQHLGIVDGAIREIAVLKDKGEIGKVFWVSHLARQAVTVPLSLLLVFLASLIATKFYHRPEIIPYIQIFALSLILQGLQDVLGATLTGMKRFGPLYSIQIITAAINIAVFGWLTWANGITGFFWAVIITTSLMVVLLFVMAARDLAGNLALPTWADIQAYGRRVMHIGAFMYLARISFVMWQRLPLLILGGVLTAERLGDLNIAQTFGSKLTIIAAALSEVNLAWMSSLYAHQREEFVKTVTRNMHRLLVLMAMMALVLILFTPEILYYVFPEYLPAEHLILVMTLAFFLYALTDIGTSSVFVSAGNPRLRTLAYGLMTLFTAGSISLIYKMRPDALLASWAVLGGVLLAYATMVILAYKKFGVSLLTRQLITFLLALAATVAFLFTDPSLIIRIIIFLALTGYLLWEAHRSKLLPTLPPFAKGYGGHGTPTRIICFAGAAYDLPAWTNRQHMMSRVSQQYPVLYIEPRMWIGKFLWQNWRQPKNILSFFTRLFWYEKRGKQLYLKAQWNLIPGSRESKIISLFNHYLNRWNVLLTARLLGFTNYQLPITKPLVWLYDTEAAQFLSAFKKSFVLYDCVDDHAAQAGMDRNVARVLEEEKAILARANLVTVTSKRLLELKKSLNQNAHLVLNAGDTVAFAPPYEGGMVSEGKAFGTVGALDSYKIDFDLIYNVAKQKPDWNFIFIGAPVVDNNHATATHQVRSLPNIRFIGSIPHEQVPAYVHQFNICLIPYKASRYNEASFPLKFWEFMATGKPIIASGLPELKEYQHLIKYISSPQEFITAGEQLLANPRQGSAERRTLAQEHSWEKRVEQVLRLIKEHV